MRGKKGGSRREGEGGVGFKFCLHPFRTTVQNFFLRLSGVNCIYSGTASVLFLFLRKRVMRTA